MITLSLTLGDTETTSGVRWGSEIALTSRSVRSFPVPYLGPPMLVEVMVIRLDSRLNWASKLVRMPLPIATSPTTAATPMTIPTMVNTERRRFFATASSAERSVSDTGIDEPDQPGFSDSKKDRTARGRAPRVPPRLGGGSSQGHRGPAS